MNRYRIGKFEGRWFNFIPPIQGGKFRPLSEAGEHDVFDNGPDSSTTASSSVSAASSSDAGSRPPSPVFDHDVDVDVNVDVSLRKRRTPAAVSSAASITSASSVEPENEGMAFLDTLTHAQIALDQEKYPPIDSATQDNIVSKYRELHQRVKKEGLYQCNYRAYAVECCRYTLLSAASFVFLQWGWYFTSAVCLGAFWHQLVFSAHDAGHMGITHDFHTDSVIGIIIADFWVVCLWAGGSTTTTFTTW